MANMTENKAVAPNSLPVPSANAPAIPSDVRLPQEFAKKLDLNSDAKDAASPQCNSSSENELLESASDAESSPEKSGRHGSHGSQEENTNGNTVGYERIMRDLDAGFDDCFNKLLQEKSTLFSTEKLDSGISISMKNGCCFKKEGAADITTICIVNPLTYAWEQHKLYIEKMPSEVTVLFVGMNPARDAPSGIPFDDRERIRDMLGIDTSALMGPDFLAEPGECDSAVKFWNLIDARFEAEDFRNHCFVINFSPLLIVGSTAEEGMRKKTFDISLGKLESSVTEFVDPLIKESQKALEKTIDLLKPKLIVPMGGYARTRIKHITSIDQQPNVPHPRVWIKEWVSEVLKKLDGDETISGEEPS